VSDKRSESAGITLPLVYKVLTLGMPPCTKAPHIFNRNNNKQAALREFANPLCSICVEYLVS
jgi:hypothetical protein